jgi:hypothetical protein
MGKIERRILWDSIWLMQCQECQEVAVGGLKVG